MAPCGAPGPSGALSDIFPWGKFFAPRGACGLTPLGQDFFDRGAGSRSPYGTSRGRTQARAAAPVRPSVRPFWPNLGPKFSPILPHLGQLREGVAYTCAAPRARKAAALSWTHCDWAQPGCAPFLRGGCVFNAAPDSGPESLLACRIRRCPNWTQVLPLICPLSGKSDTGIFLAHEGARGLTLPLAKLFRGWGRGKGPFGASCTRPGTCPHTRPLTPGRGRSFALKIRAKNQPFLPTLRDGLPRESDRQPRLRQRSRPFPRPNLHHHLLLAVPAKQDQIPRPGLLRQLQKLAPPTHRAHDPRRPRGYPARQFVRCFLHVTFPVSVICPFGQMQFPKSAFAYAAARARFFPALVKA